MKLWILRWRDAPGLYRWDLSAITCYKRKAEGHLRNTCREGNVKTEADTGAMWPQVRECQPPATSHQKPEQTKKGFPSREKEAWPYWYLDLALLASRTERISICALNPPSLWLLQPPQEMNTDFALVVTEHMRQQQLAFQACLTAQAQACAGRMHPRTWVRSPWVQTLGL